MKKNILCLIFFALSFIMFPNNAIATEKNPIHKTAKADEIPAEIRVMIDRINEIKEMDKSDLTRAEKKELRKEVRTIKKNVKASGNGLYLSSGAIIIILLVIIIL